MKILCLIILLFQGITLFAQHSEDYRWDDKFGAPGIDAIQNNGIPTSPIMATLLDGTKIYVGGEFNSAGNNIALWDTQTGQWKQMGTGTNGVVNVLRKWKDYIVVGGKFTLAGEIKADNIALWNTKTEQWEKFDQGIEGPVTALCEYKNQLYVAGEFVIANGKTVNGICRWTGNEWEKVGKGVYGGKVNALIVYKDMLWVGGNFNAADADTIKAKIAVWDGNVWSDAPQISIGYSWQNSVTGFAVVGDKLFVTGSWYWNEIIINTTPKKNIPELLYYDGKIWTDPVKTFGKFTSQTQILGGIQLTSNSTNLIVAFSNLEEVDGITANGIAVWNAITNRWTALGSGISGATSIQSLACDENTIIVGGRFQEAGGLYVNNIALYKLNTQRWEPFSSKAINGLYGINNNFTYNSKIFTLNNRIIAMGGFEYASNTRVNGLAEWKNGVWSPFGIGIQGGITNRRISQLEVVSGYLSSMTEYNNTVLIGGDFAGIGGTNASCIAVYDKTQFREFQGGVTGAVSLGSRTTYLSVDCFFVDGNDLYIGGTFTEVGGKKVNHIARWDGNQWHDVGGGISLNSTLYVPKVQVIKKLPDGRLIIGGQFAACGGKAMTGVAIWDGNQWNSTDIFSANEIVPVVDIEIVGNTVYAVGTFSRVNGIFMNNIMQWNGNTWSDMQNGVVSGITSLINDIHRDNDKLYVGGWFQAAGNTEAQNIAYWDITQQQWYQMGSGTDKSVTNIVTRNDSVFVSGIFQRAGMSYSSNFALWLPKNSVSVEEDTDIMASNSMVYPNPASSVLTIHCEQNQRSLTSIVITDYIGRVVDIYYPNDSDNNYVIDVQSYSSGLYFVSIYSDTSYHTIPFSVIH